MKGKIVDMTAKLLSGGAGVLMIAMEDGTKGSFYDVNGTYPAILALGEIVEYTTKVTEKNGYKTVYLQFPTVKKSDDRNKMSMLSLDLAPLSYGQGIPPTNSGTIYQNKMDPETALRVSRLSCLTSAAQVYSGQASVNVAEILKLAEIFVDYAYNGLIEDKTMSF